MVDTWLTNPKGKSYLYAHITGTMRHIICLALVASLALAEDVKVKTPKGVIKGTRIDHDFGQYFYAFRGVRYAKAPTDELRFMVFIFDFIVAVFGGV